MVYYTETNYWDHDTLRTSHGKGRDDYFEVLRRMGFKCIKIPTVRTGNTHSAAERITQERKLYRAWVKCTDDLGQGDILIIHSPNSEKFLKYGSVIRRIRKRGCKVIVILFELETFFRADYARFGRIKRAAAKHLESILFRTADVIIAHNDKMKARLESIGVNGNKVVSVGVMDYLRDDPVDKEACLKRITKNGPVVLCSNLAPNKSVFAYHLPECLRIDLYGPDYTGPVNDMVHYRGVYDPVELMDVMEGSFGLVWDSTSPDTCDGPFGEYMLFNNPHKIALYLASGMPVIVWDESAMADFVREEDCGFMVGSLREIPDHIAILSDEDYARMRDNAMRVGADMRKGAHIRSAVEKAVRMLQPGYNDIHKGGELTAEK